jgi:cell division protein FtsB
MLKPMLEMGIPIPPEVLDYSPLPNDLAQKWKEMMQPDPEQQQQQQMQLDLERRDKEAEIKKDESHAVLNFAKAAETSAKAGKTASGG